MSRFKISKYGNIEEKIMEIIEELDERKSEKDHIRYTEIISILDDTYEKIPSSNAIRNWILDYHRDKYEIVSRRRKEGIRQAGLKVKTKD